MDDRALNDRITSIESRLERIEQHLKIQTTAVQQETDQTK